ncbi:hypothetical protein N665_0412s0033 [Sinapis alba]|nr:hypothetical protein N665_0412s0033 [Sinapis alba]
MPMYDETLVISCRDLSSVISDGPKTISPRPASRFVACSMSKTSTPTSMCKDTLQHHFAPSPQPVQTSAYSDKLVSLIRSSPLSYRQRDPSTLKKFVFHLHQAPSRFLIAPLHMKPTSNCRRLRPRYHGSVRQLHQALSTILFISVSNSQIKLEMKRVSTASPSRLPIFLLPGSLEIHLVSRGNIDGYFNVSSDYLKLFRAVVSRIQVKIICRSLYFELNDHQSDS